MRRVLGHLGLGLWRLIPANPILVRVVFASGRRPRHLWIRAGYLCVLAVLVVFGVVFAHRGVGVSLAELAKRATIVFEQVSLVQLTMVCILAPLFTAGAITQEKDSRTYDILLSTPLSNAQVVLGSLFSRLYFVFVLLFAGVPLFCIMMVYGGVTGDKIALAIALSASTALITGAVAIAISVVKIGTGRTIFTFYLTIAAYLIILYSLASWSGFILLEAEPAPGRSERMSWLAPFHPFLALLTALGRTPAPSLAQVAHHGSPLKYLLAYPAQSYVAMTVLASFVLIVGSLLFVRRGSRLGERTLLARLLRRQPAVGVSEGRAPRLVWHNPVAWREAMNRASGGGLLVRYFAFAIGIIVGLLLLLAHALGRLDPASLRAWLFGVVAVELAMTLFLSTASAATSLTREKESQTLELLLTTTLTSAAIIRGKLRGLVAAAGPMLAVPWLTVTAFALYDLLSGRRRGPVGPIVYWESPLALACVLVAFSMFASLVGLHYSIKSRKTLTAVMVSMTLVIGAFGLTGGCAMAVRQTGAPALTSALMPFTPFTALYQIIDPSSAFVVANTPTPPAELLKCRMLAWAGSVLAAVTYGLVVVAMHATMVRSFDMTIRKQTV